MPLLRHTKRNPQYAPSSILEYLRVHKSVSPGQRQSHCLRNARESLWADLDDINFVWWRTLSLLPTDQCGHPETVQSQNINDRKGTNNDGCLLHDD